MAEWQKAELKEVLNGTEPKWSRTGKRFHHHLSSWKTSLSLNMKRDADGIEYSTPPTPLFLAALHLLAESSQRPSEWILFQCRHSVSARRSWNSKSLENSFKLHYPQTLLRDILGSCPWAPTGCTVPTLWRLNLFFPHGHSYPHTDYSWPEGKGSFKLHQCQSTYYYMDKCQGVREKKNHLQLALLCLYKICQGHLSITLKVSTAY